MRMAVEAEADLDWTVCPQCRAMIYSKRLDRSLGVCPECDHHIPLAAPQRLRQILDPGSGVVLDIASTAPDPLQFSDTRPYLERVHEARDRTDLDEAVRCVRGSIEGNPVVVAGMDFRFLGGSLGSVVGERITRAAETALAERTPLVVITASGGARMQEGIVSLMQMAKTSQAFAELDEAGVLTVCLVTDPTYAGTAASFASLADVILAEPGARMGFTGPRVIAQTIGETLPDGFQTAEFLLRHGLIDGIRPRSRQRATLAGLLTNSRPQQVRSTSHSGLVRDPADLRQRDPWQIVQLGRNPDRPTTVEYLARILDDFQELRGDRISGDCPAIVGGIGRLAGSPVVAVGHQKGHTTAELVARRYGMPTPDGYHKAARLFRLAAKLGLPVITLVDTPGAYPGVAAEERGQAIAIAEVLRLLSGLPVPVVATITGEGGSGGALALAVANRVLCLENAFYSVISPEGCAAILWRDPAQAPRAAAALRVDPAELLRLGVIDGVVREPDGGAHRNPAAAADRIRAALTAELAELSRLGPADLVRSRRARFRRFGAPDTGSPAAVGLAEVTR